MIKFNNEDLYGLSFLDYCEYININPDDLISQTQKKIEILENRLKELRPIYRSGNESLEPLILSIRKHLENKKESLKKYIKWRNDGK